MILQLLQPPEISEQLPSADREAEGRRILNEASFRYLKEITLELQGKGIPDEVLAFMGAHAISRMRGPSMTDIARSMFPVEKLPQGALPFFVDDKHNVG